MGMCFGILAGLIISIRSVVRRMIVMAMARMIVKCYRMGMDNYLRRDSRHREGEEQEEGYNESSHAIAE